MYECKKNDPRLGKNNMRELGETVPDINTGLGRVPASTSQNGSLMIHRTMGTEEFCASVV